MLIDEIYSQKIAGKKFIQDYENRMNKIRQSDIYKAYYDKYSKVNFYDLFIILKILKDEEYRNTHPMAEIEIFVCKDIISEREKENTH